MVGAFGEVLVMDWGIAKVLRSSGIPADSAALAADIGRFRAGHAVSAHRETVAEQAWRLARTYRTPLLLVIAYLLMRTLIALTTGR